MKTKFTPGPWKATLKNGNEFEIIAKSPNVSGKVQVVANLNGPWSHENYASNAKLISAAPELLAALEALVKCPDYRGISTHEMSQAREAIAKAKGVS